MAASSRERRVRERAQDRCEYCHAPAGCYETPFHIEHIIARKHGGKTVDSNLALACFQCNLFKGPNIAGLDPETGALTQLFHPRRDAWADHFAREGPEIKARTAVGRTTILILRMNDSNALFAREMLIEEGRMPKAE